MTTVARETGPLAAMLPGFAQGYGCGFAQGYEEGLQEARTELARSWREMARKIARWEPYAELEVLRYGPGGREHFGDPRPGDFPGRRR